MESTPKTPKPPTRFARVRWPIIIVAMLSGHVGAMVLAVNVALGDGAETGNGHSVLPSYYERAVNWDEDRAAMSRSDDLGWLAVITPAVLNDADGSRSVTIDMRDDAGYPLTDLTIHAKAWHHAVGKIVEGGGEPMAGADGFYSLELPMGQAGLWSFELTAVRGGDAFVSESTLEITSNAALLGPSER